MIGVLGRERAMLSIVVVGAFLTYGGVSLFVVVFAVYPFAAEMFRQSDIPKRLIPGTIALGAFTFTMDSLPGTPQSRTSSRRRSSRPTIWAAPWLGIIGGLFILRLVLPTWIGAAAPRRRSGEGYGTELINEPEPYQAEKLPHLARFSPLVLVGVANKF